MRLLDQVFQRNTIYHKYYPYHTKNRLSIHFKYNEFIRKSYLSIAVLCLWPIRVILFYCFTKCRNAHGKINKQTDREINRKAYQNANDPAPHPSINPIFQNKVVSYNSHYQQPSFFHFSVPVQKYRHAHIHVKIPLLYVTCFSHTSQYTRTIFKRVQQRSNVQETKHKGFAITGGDFSP